MNFKLGVTLIVLGAMASSNNAAASLKFCDGAQVSVRSTDGPLPIEVDKNLIQATHLTTGWVELKNVSSKKIAEITLSILYSASDEGGAVEIRYFRTTSSPVKSQSYLWKAGLMPEGVSRIIGSSVWMLKSCPTRADIKSVDIVYSDGSHFKTGDATGGTNTPPQPSKLEISSLDPLDWPTNDSTFLLQLQLTASGQVERFTAVGSHREPLPLSLGRNIPNWKFDMADASGNKNSRVILVVVRLIRSDCQIDFCSFPYDHSELTSPFMLIDTYSSNSRVVLIGGSPMRDNGLPF